VLVEDLNVLMRCKDATFLPYSKSFAQSYS